jgi:hypothetical protein
VQVGLVVGLDGGDPVIELLAVAAGEDLGERDDVAGQGVDVGAAVACVLELGLLVLVQGIGLA